MAITRREVGTMEQGLTTQWREESPSLHAAYVTTVEGRQVYVGYVATSPGCDSWRGYSGVGFVPVGSGPRAVMQAAVEQRGREILAWAGWDGGS